MKHWESKFIDYCCHTTIITFAFKYRFKISSNEVIQLSSNEFLMPGNVETSNIVNYCLNIGARSDWHAHSRLAVPQCWDRDGTDPPGLAADIHLPHRDRAQGGQEGDRGVFEVRLTTSFLGSIQCLQFQMCSFDLRLRDHHCRVLCNHPQGHQRPAGGHLQQDGPESLCRESQHGQEQSRDVLVRSLNDQAECKFLLPAVRWQRSPWPTPSSLLTPWAGSGVSWSPRSSPPGSSPPALGGWWLTSGAWPRSAASLSRLTSARTNQSANGWGSWSQTVTTTQRWKSWIK